MQSIGPARASLNLKSRASSFTPSISISIIKFLQPPSSRSWSRPKRAVTAPLSVLLAYPSPRRLSVSREHTTWPVARKRWSEPRPLVALLKGHVQSPTFSPSIGLISFKRIHRATVRLHNPARIKRISWLNSYHFISSSTERDSTNAIDNK